MKSFKKENSVEVIKILRPPKRSCIFGERLQQAYPFITKTFNDSNVRCEKCDASFSVANGGKYDIEKHLKTKKHNNAINSMWKVEKMEKLENGSIDDDNFSAQDEDLNASSKECVVWDSHVNLVKNNNSREPSPHLAPKSLKRSRADLVIDKISKRIAQSGVVPTARKRKFDALGEHIAEKLRSIPVGMAPICEKLISDAIFLAEMSSLNITSRIVTELNTTPAATTSDALDPLAAVASAALDETI